MQLRVGEQNPDQHEQDDHRVDRQAARRPGRLGPPEREDQRDHGEREQRQPRFARTEPVDRCAQQGRGEGGDPAGNGVRQGEQRLTLHRIADDLCREVGAEDVDGDQDHLRVAPALVKRPAHCAAR
jgi:hypothetical protein